MTTTFKILGDVHLGKVFVNNVPLNRRGDHEKIVWKEFERQLDPEGAEVHVNLGDLFDRPYVPYSVLDRAAQLYLNAARSHPDTEFVVLRGNHDASRDMEAVSASTSSRGSSRANPTSRWWTVGSSTGARSSSAGTRSRPPQKSSPTSTKRTPATKSMWHSATGMWTADPIRLI